MKKAFIVTTKQEKYINEAKVLERLLNRPDVIAEAEKQIDTAFKALVEGPQAVGSGMFRVVTKK